MKNNIIKKYKYFIFLIVGSIVILSFIIFLWLYSSLPIINGTLFVKNIEGNILIVRDKHGVPYIRTSSNADAAFALGFVHAQDRLWQLEFQRRLGAGRLSEIIGKKTLVSDKLYRTLGLYQSAEQAFKSLNDFILPVFFGFSIKTSVF